MEDRVTESVKQPVKPLAGGRSALAYAESLKASNG
jgi:hypothetical protein